MEDRDMTANEKRIKLATMRKVAREHNRVGDVVLRDQMLRSIAEAKATWVVRAR
jgi:hypothetical protein